jgi:hypothetical protein
VPWSCLRSAVSFNVLLLWLTKRMSGTWAQVASVLCLDVSSLFSQWSFLMGNEASSLKYEDYLGLVIAAVALWVYNLQDEVDASGELIKGSSPHLPTAQTGTDHHHVEASTANASPISSFSTSPQFLPSSHAASPQLPSYNISQAAAPTVTPLIISTKDVR